MLVTVNHQGGACSVEVRQEGFESLMHLLIAFMDSSRRVVGHENIDGREGLHARGNFGLLIHVVTSGLVFPTTGKPCEPHSFKRRHRAMQVHYTLGKWRISVVISPNCKNLAWLIVIDGPLDGCIMQVPAGNENVNASAWPLAEMRIVIGNRKDRHEEMIAEIPQSVNAAVIQLPSSWKSAGNVLINLCQGDCQTH
jgi:hypothetical protein